MTRLGRLIFAVVAEGVGLLARLVGCGLHHRAQPTAHPMQDRGHGTGRGPGVLARALLSACVQCRVSRQPRGGDARAKRRVVVRMGGGERLQRFRRLRMQVFPAFAPTAGRWRTETHAPGASLRQATRHGLASPTQDRCGPEGGAPTLLHRHLGPKGSPCRPVHLGCRQAYIGNVRRTARLPACQRRVVQAHAMTSRTESGFPSLEEHLSKLTLAQ